MSLPGRNVLLLELYPFRKRPFIPPYLYLGAFLDALGIDHSLYRWLGDADELLALVERDRIGMVWINLVMGPVLGVVEPVCRLLKARWPEIQIWVGGTAVYFIRPLLEHCPDIDRVSTGHPCYDADGFAVELYEAGLLTAMPPRPYSFPPLSANTHLKEFLHQHQRGDQMIGAINMASSSGCNARCSFCYLARTRPWAQPLDGLLADLVMLQQDYDVRYFEFSDDNFTADRGRLEAFCLAIQSSGLDFSFFCLSSADTLDAQTLELMLAGGLKRLYIGVDALHPQNIRKLKKPYTSQAARAAVDLVRSYPIDLSLALVLGCPGETREQLQELYDWAASVSPEVSEISFFTPYPGTSTYRQALRLGFRPPDTLQGWAETISLVTLKGMLNPSISAEEYEEWMRRFKGLATYRYRSGIGESARRIKSP